MPRPRVKADKRPVRRRNLPPWESSGMFQIGIKTQKKALVLMIMPMAGFWECAAIETSTSNDTIDKVFEDHGHKVLGRFEDMQKAVSVCEAYGRKWRTGQEKIEACECKEIMKHAKPVIDAEYDFQRVPKRSRRRKAA
jgi:hypothetical protein